MEYQYRNDLRKQYHRGHTDILPQYKILNAHQKGVPLPLANSTMETYEQKDSNCIDCHSGATNHDGKLKSDFVWFLSQELK